MDLRDRFFPKFLSEFCDSCGHWMPLTGQSQEKAPATKSQGPRISGGAVRSDVNQNLIQKINRSWDSLASPHVIAGPDPAIHLCRETMDTRVKPAYDD
jgi:hypothetical protein